MNVKQVEKKRKNKKAEILAPVGQWESLQVALQEGADAVFFGSGRFHARSQRVGLAAEDLPAIMSMVKRYGKKAYLTMNTLVYQEEMQEALDFAVLAYEAGVDALIIQDIGLASLLHEYLPQMELHASTQMAVHSPEALVLAAKLGMNRIVLPRELSLEEIQAQTALAETLGLETEVFVHGALCICYSGHCQLSRQIGGRSANRGSCAQPCRLTYQLEGQQKPFPILSSKDISYLDYLPDLLKAGVASFKIEGRMRSPDYVRESVRSFRQKLDQGFVSASQKQNLLQVFNRGGKFTQARLFRKRGKDILSGPFVGHLGVYYGQLTKVIPSKGLLIFKLAKENLPPLIKGDVLALHDENHVFSAPVGTAVLQRGQYEVKGFHPSVLEKLKGQNLAIYRSKSAALENGGPNQEKVVNEIMHEKLGSATQGQLPLTYVLDVKPFVKPKTYCLKASVTLPEGQSLVAMAEKEAEDCPALSKERCQQQLSKLGNTAYFCTDVICSQDVSLRVSSLNALRRTVVSSLDQNREASHLRHLSKEQRQELKTGWQFSWKGLEAVKANLTARLPTHHQPILYLPGWRHGDHLPVTNQVNCRYFLPFVELALFYEKQEREFYHFLTIHQIGAVLPPGAPLYIYEKAGRYLPLWKSEGLYAQVASGLSFVPCPNLPIYLLPDANVANLEAAKWYMQQGVVGMALAYELSDADRILMEAAIHPLEILWPMGADEAMTFEHCPVGFGQEGCQRCSKQRLFALHNQRDSFWYLPLPGQSCSGKLYAKELTLASDLHLDINMDEIVASPSHLHNRTILLTILPGWEKELPLLLKKLSQFH